MSWEMGQSERDALLGVSGPKRYAYFVKKVVDHGEIWLLSYQEGVVLASDGDREILPVWPHEEFASICADGPWHDAYPKKVELLKWLEQWSYEMRSDQRSIAVFPTPDGRGVVVKADRLAEDLRNELANYL